MLLELTVDEVVVDAAHSRCIKFHSLLLCAANFLFLQEFVQLKSFLLVKIALEKELKCS